MLTEFVTGLALFAAHLILDALAYGLIIAPAIAAFVFADSRFPPRFAPGWLRTVSCLVAALAGLAAGFWLSIVVI